MSVNVTTTVNEVAVNDVNKTLIVTEDKPTTAVEITQSDIVLVTDTQEAKVNVTQPITDIVVLSSNTANVVDIYQPISDVVNVIAQGPQGPQGTIGPIGPQGPSGSAVGVGVEVFNAFTQSYYNTTGSFAITGSNRFNGNQIITGSLNVTAGITGSLRGTSSWANNSVSSSYTLTASYALNSGAGGTTINTSSFATTGSNRFNGDQIITGSITSTGIIYTSQIQPEPGNHLYSIIPPGQSFDMWTEDAGGEIVVNSYGVLLQTNATINTWTFDKSANLTIPGNIIAPANSKIYIQNVTGIIPKEGISSYSDPITQLGSQGDFSGETIKGSAGEGLESGQLIYLYTDGLWYKANATPDGTNGNRSATHLLGIVVSDGNVPIMQNDIFTVLLQGNIYTNKIAGSEAPGSPLWIDTTAGNMINSAPASPGNIIRQVGHILASHVIRFNPDNYYSIV